MSQWYEVKKEDISFSIDGEDMHFWLESDENGNVYASAKIKDIKDLLAHS